MYIHNKTQLNMKRDRRAHGGQLKPLVTGHCLSSAILHTKHISLDQVQHVMPWQARGVLADCRPPPQVIQQQAAVTTISKSTDIQQFLLRATLACNAHDSHGGAQSCLLSVSSQAWHPPLYIKAANKCVLMYKLQLSQV